ncbi:MAG: glycosyltransferase, partial [Actinobacteria bacterium]|nr:glycosyltransferase [Actinomycetota bacterium]
MTTRVAQVITKFVAGAGGITLRGSLALDPDRFSVTIFAPAGGPFADKAQHAGLQVVPLSHLAPVLSARGDLRAVRELTALFTSKKFDIVHTHSAKAGGVGRVAAQRAGLPAVVHSFHGLPFHEFQAPARRKAYIVLERRLGRITDQFLTDGAAVAAEAVRLRIAPPERIRAIASPIDTAEIIPVTVASRAEARRLLGVPPDMHVVGTVGR